MATQQPQGEIFKFRMRRKNPGRSWGFVLQGGSDNQLPIYVQKCGQHSIAFKAGLRAGDAVCMINDSNVTRHRLDQAKMEITRSANDISFVVQRGILDLNNPVFAIDPDRPEVVEDDPLRTQASPQAPPPEQDPATHTRSFRMLLSMVDGEQK